MNEFKRSNRKSLQKLCAQGCVVTTLRPNDLITLHNFKLTHLCLWHPFVKADEPVSQSNTNTWVATASQNKISHSNYLVDGCNAERKQREVRAHLCYSSLGL